MYDHHTSIITGLHSSDSHTMNLTPSLPGPRRYPSLLDPVATVAMHAKALAAFIGVTPRQRLSGSSVKGRTLMSRTGHAALRRALYMPGLVARRHNPVLKVFGDRLSAAGLAPKAVVGAVMRKLAHLIYGVIKSGKPFDATVAMPRVAFQDGI